MLVVAGAESRRVALRRLLEAGGYQADVAAGEADAVARLERDRFDGAVVDVDGGGAEGLVVLERVRAIAPDTPALAVVTEGAGAVARRALRAGADDVLVDPVGAAQVQASLARTEHWRARVEALRRRNAELERQAEERAAAHARLDRLKEEFLATASHELKGPLTSIRGYAQLLLRSLRAPAPDLARLAQGLAVIDAQSAAMAELLSHLLDASRVQAGKIELRPAPCELGECLAAVLAGLGPEERARVAVALDDAPLAGQWERARIEQVLANLVRNALKYSPAPAPVEVRAERHGEEIAVSVADRGMGLPSEELPRLFARFHRTPGALASGLPGTGLGLYICRGIVAAHGGRIWAESPGVGEGATFRFTLPVSPPGAGAAGTPERVPGEEG
jgi:signal transduction histidine kinase